MESGLIAIARYAFIFACMYFFSNWYILLLLIMMGVDLEFKRGK